MALLALMTPEAHFCLSGGNSTNVSHSKSDSHLKAMGMCFMELDVITLLM